MVGPDEYRFDVHKDLLCKASPFFKAAFDGNFAEAAGIMKLPEEDVMTFKHFIYWLYSRRLRRLYYPDSELPTIAQLERDKDKEASKLGVENLQWDNPVKKRLDYANYRDVPLLSLVRLYILADTLQIAGLQDHVITIIDDIYYPPSKVRSPFWQQGDSREDLENPVQSINIAWTMTSKDSKLRDILISIVCGHVRDLSREAFNDTFSPEFIHEAYSRCWDWHHESEKAEGNYDVCCFHKHDAGCPDDDDFPRWPSSRQDTKVD